MRSFVPSSHDNILRAFCELILLGSSLPWSKKSGLLEAVRSDGSYMEIPLVLPSMRILNSKIQFGSPPALDDCYYSALDRSPVRKYRRWHYCQAH